MNGATTDSSESLLRRTLTRLGTRQRINLGPTQPPTDLTHYLSRGISTQYMTKRTPRKRTDDVEVQLPAALIVKKSLQCGARKSSGKAIPPIVFS